MNKYQKLKILFKQMTLEGDEKSNRPDCGQIIKSGMQWALSADEFEADREISKLVMSKNEFILIPLIPILVKKLKYNT
jgi:hypothetical protein